MPNNIKRKFHNFVMVMEEEARLYEAVQKVLEENPDKEKAAKLVYSRYAKDLKSAMEKSKIAWLEWQSAMAGIMEK